MAIEARRREGESTGSLLRRFSKKIQMSGVLLSAREKRFYIPPKSKREKHLSALHRLTVQKQKNILRKLGKLEEDSKVQKRKFK